MAYNHRKAELEWLNWKEKEEKQLRELEVNEDVIQRLHTYDWQQFNKERRFLQRWKDEAPSGEILHKNHVREIHSADELLDEIENEKLFVLLNTVDRLTLEILVSLKHCRRSTTNKIAFCTFPEICPLPATRKMWIYSRSELKN